jgi:hypothetical protein
MQITGLTKFLLVALMATAQAAPVCEVMGSFWKVTNTLQTVEADASLAPRHHRGAGGNAAGGKGAGGAAAGGAGGLAGLFGGNRNNNNNNKRHQ